jgi:hypothetical protein
MWPFRKRKTLAETSLFTRLVFISVVRGGY